MKIQKKYNLFPLSLTLLLLLRIVSSFAGHTNDVFFPTIQDFLLATRDLFVEKFFAIDIGVSILRVGVAFVLSFVLAIPLALCITGSKTFHSIVSPYINFTKYLPVPALIPLTILFLGIGETAKVTLLFIGTFFQFVIVIVDNLNNIPKEYFDLAYTLQYSRRKTIKMRLSSIAPELFENSRLMIGLCRTYLVIAELVAADSGIGHIINQAQRFSNIPDLYVGIVILGVIGFLTGYIFEKLYPILFRYKRPFHD